LLNVLIFYFLSLLLSQSFLMLRLKYYQARLFSILFITLITYLFSFFFPFKIVFYTVFSIFITLSVYAVVKNNFKIRLDRNEEFIFVVFLAYFIFLRSLIPDIYGAEKFMDMAFINSVLKSHAFPPNDPYFAGGKLNIYYYFGHVIGAVITLISFTKPEVGYNIAMAAISALSFLMIFGFLKEFVEERYAAVGSIFVLFSGNLYAAIELFYKLFTFQRIGYLFYWNATRVIEDSTFGYAITEFPYFSFIHADFHAHVVAIPITLLCLAFLYDFYKGDRLKGYLLIPLLFILFATNSWSFPVIFLLMTTIFLIKEFKGKRDLLIVVASSSISILLLYFNMKNASSKISLTTETTNLWQFIEFFGIQIAFAYYYLINSTSSSRVGNDVTIKRLIPLIVVVASISYFFIPISLILIPLIVLSVRKVIKGDLLASFILTACITILIAEVFMIDCRMNTIFKFYLVSWLLLTIPPATKLKRIFKDVKVRRPLNVVMLILFTLTLIYPVIATPVRHYDVKLSLDGMEFIKRYNKGDYNAIHWLRDKDGVVVEAVCKCYSYCSRISTFSGNPTIVAWTCHEVKWRGNGKELVERINDVRLIYTSQNCSKVTWLLNKYDVKYVVVGDEERRVYNVNTTKFETCGLSRAFKGDDTIIYEFSTKS